jgi:hypothetical protein
VTRGLLAGALWVSVVCAQPAIHFDARGQSVEVIGLDALLLASLAGGPPGDLPLSRAFGVYLGDAKLPILGDYEVDGAVLRFKPRFPFLAGRVHRVLVDIAELYRLTERPAPPETLPALNSMFTVAELARSPKSRVVRISPAADRLPANLLRIYVYFSHPMSRRGIARHIRLTDADGKPVEEAFLEMEDGLWDPEGLRLTLFFHPGRIKRGLVLHDKLGPPLRAGRRYRLVVAKDAEDEEGLPLVEDFVKEFTALPEDRASSDSGWPNRRHREALPRLRSSRINRWTRLSSLGPCEWKIGRAILWREYPRSIQWARAGASSRARLGSPVHM